MPALLTKDRIYLGADACYVGQLTSFGNRMPEFRACVMGHQFGPTFLYVGGDLGEAFDEWDERHGQRVEMDDAALLDYDPEPHHLADAKGDRALAGMFAAMDEGDIRINDGGTTVWVDHYEWCRTFDSVKEAATFYRSH